jgi:putative flavoprotein involved in K+ transport
LSDLTSPRSALPILTERVETVIVGGGQAGLAMSYYLGQLGCEHVILERRRVAERWRSERWDSLCFQAPSWNMRLPGFDHQAADPDAFAPRDDVVRYIEEYACAISAPIRCGVAATALGQKPGSTRLMIESTAGGFEAKNVVIATGPFQIPAPHPSLCCKALQLHSSQYRNPELLPPGAVLIVGSGNSGCQIAEELSASRRVYLSVSGHQRTPRRYRGKDCIWWNLALGDADRTVDQRVDAQPSRLMTGVGGGHDVDLRRLAADGVVLLGRALGGRDGRIALAPDLGENLARGDASLIALMRRCDEHVVRNGLDFPAPDTSREALPYPAEAADPILTLDLAAADISTIIWANGFRYDFSWIDLPIFANCAEASHRVPSHKRGISCVPGVYFLGLPWLHKWKSAFLFGVGEDAGHLAAQIARDSQP